MRGQRGEVSLMALLVSMSLLLGVLGATLGLFEGVTRVAGDGTRRTDSQDAARSAVDRITGALRNLASPTVEGRDVIDFAGPQDLVFKTVDSVGPNSGANVTNTKRVRYCLDPSTSTLQEQTQTWTTPEVPVAPSRSGCPASDWTRTQVIASGVVNLGVPLFAYDSADPKEITSVHLDLLVDADPLRAPGATKLSSGIFLRNQNRKPTVSFTATKSPGLVVLNGSASSDPEGKVLDYFWYDNGVALTQENGVPVAGGPTLNVPVAAGSSHVFMLVVVDPGGLKAQSETQAVTG